MRLIYSLFILTFMLPLSVVHAQTAAEPSLPKSLEQFVKQGAQVYYLGSYEKMNGWVLIRQGRPEYFYENPEHTALVMGLLFNDEGQMITMAQLSDLKKRVGDELYATTNFNIARDEAGAEPVAEAGAEMQEENAPVATATDTAPAPAPVEASPAPVATETTQGTPLFTNDDSLATPLTGRAPTPAELMYADIIKANWFTINPQGSQDVFVFVDPDCKHCQDFINTSENFIQDGSIRLRVVPVGVNEDSARRAAVLLASADPGERLKRYAKGDKDALPAPQSINLDAVDANTSVMVKHRFDVTPVVVYRTKQGKIRLIRGKPQNYENVLRDINEN